MKFFSVEQKKTPIAASHTTYAQRFSAVFTLATSLFLGACGSGGFVDIPDNYSSFSRAHILASDQVGINVGQDILNIGGNAADVTVAIGFAAIASLPARMSLEARGQCVGYDSRTQSAFNLDFSRGDMHALHGLVAIQAQYGQLPWAGVIAPTHRLALQGSGLFSRQMNGESLNAPSHLWDDANQTLPRPILAKTLETLMRHPLNYMQMPPFSAQVKWATKLGFTAPKAIKSGENIVALTEKLGIRSGHPSVIFGAMDKTGLAISCNAGLGRAYGKGWNTNLDGAEATLDTAFSLPQNAVAFNENNQRLKWLAAFEASVSKETLLNSWAALSDDNDPKLKQNIGYAMAYCPIGLPNKQPNNPLLCATFSGAPKTLGRATRQ